MSSHDLTLAVYGLICLVGVGMQFRSYSPRSRIPPLGDVFGWAMRTRSGRVGIVAGWVWLGLHFFAR